MTLKSAYIIIHDMAHGALFCIESSVTKFPDFNAYLTSLHSGIRYENESSTKMISKNFGSVICISVSHF